MKKRKYLLVIFILGFLLTLGISFAFRVSLKEYKDTNFKVQYDSTWKVESDNQELKLVHKQSGSIVRIQCKELDKNYMDISLSDLIVDIMYSIEEQNTGYHLIKKLDSPTEKYESYSYLYESGMKQALVHVYKKDNKLVLAYYEANSEYYDIVLDSVDTLLSSLEIYTGEKVN